MLCSACPWLVTPFPAAWLADTAVRLRAEERLFLALPPQAAFQTAFAQPAAAAAAAAAAAE